MAIYRLKLFTSESGHEKKDRNYCIDNNIMAIGWPINGVTDINTYRKQAKNHKDYSNNEILSGGLKVSLNAIENIKKGDLVWTQIDGLDYRLGRVELYPKKWTHKSSECGIKKKGYRKWKNLQKKKKNY